MGRYRITIGRLLLVIAHFGVGFAALRSPLLDLGKRNFFSMVVACYGGGYARSHLTTRIVAGVLDGLRRCGWLYLGLSIFQLGGSNISPLMITTALMDLVYPTIDRLSGMNRIGNSTEIIWQYWSLPPQDAAPFNWAVPEPYRAICHAIITPILALLGGLLARRLHRTRDELDA